MPLSRPAFPTRFLRHSFIGVCGSAALAAQEIPEPVYGFLDNHCLNCHDSVEMKGDLDLEEMSFDLTDPHVFETWVKVHDRADHGEMPPKEKRRPAPSELATFLANLRRPLESTDQLRRQQHGRATVRRLNRFEYENKLRHLLRAPWLQVADDLPEDGTAHLFNKVGERLDVSHVQMGKYLEAAQKTLRTAVNTAAFPAETQKYYLRDEPGVHPYLWYRPGLQVSATRAVVPLLGLEPELGVIRKTQPVTVGESDPVTRELEALGTFSGTYSATTKYDFKRERRPIDGRYRLRLKSYAFLGGLNGMSGGQDNGLTDGNVEWWRPNRNFAYRAERSEPVTLYALAASDDSRWLATYDAHPDPSITEHVVDLKAGEGIRPDAARLIRTRPGWDGNANATAAGVPGVAFNWLEVEGPLHEDWPPPCYQTLFGDLPFTVEDDRKVTVQSASPQADAQRLLWHFLQNASNRPLTDESTAEPYLEIFHQAREFGESFTEAMISAYSAILCSPDFLYLEAQPGPLKNHELAQRLAYFLWNGPPDAALQNQANLAQPEYLVRHAERLLADPRSDRFINAFLDYWLDLRDIKLNAPDASLYTDYYLDELLTESAVRETRLFFRELIAQDLPARNLIDSDFTFVNERLAQHYRLPASPGVNPQKIELPASSPRGGLLTQTSVLTVTANGTTTSPVIRGAWIMERIMGLEIPPPPSGVEAVEPDTRGATTIREQISRHIEAAACSTCHEKTDPAGFALENFDVMGGWQDRYRAVDEAKTPVDGIGKNGHAFPFHYAQPVDSSGVLKDGRAFTDIHAFKALLGQEERTIARNLVHRLIVYGTGAPVSFADRAEVEQILDATADSNYGMRSLITAVVQSPLFTIK